MFFAKGLKYVAGGVGLLLIAAGLMLGPQLTSQPVDDATDLPESRTVPIINEVTVLEFFSVCPICLGTSPVYPAYVYSHWYGITRTQLESLLDRQDLAWTLISFDAERVVVHTGTERCPECVDKWPEAGYIGIYAGKLAIFNTNGALVEILELNPPGDWYPELQEGIPFSSPQECEDLLFNICS